MGHPSRQKEPAQGQEEPVEGKEQASGGGGVAQALEPDPVPGGQGPLEARVKAHGQQKGKKPPGLPPGQASHRRGTIDQEARQKGHEGRKEKGGPVGHQGEGQGGEDRPQAEAHVDPVQELPPPFGVEVPHQAVAVDVHDPLGQAHEEGHGHHPGKAWGQGHPREGQGQEEEGQRKEGVAPFPLGQADAQEKPQEEACEEPGDLLAHAKGLPPVGEGGPRQGHDHAHQEEGEKGP